MAIWELFLTAVGVSMDAFAVAICLGMAMTKAKWKNALIVGTYFGSFQALMPLIGFLLGTQFADRITSVDHWVAFILLSFIGGKMIREANLKKKNPDSGQDVDGSLHWKQMLPMSFATSIDALALGVSYAFLKIDMVTTVVFIGVVTLLFSAAGVKIGKIAGMKFQSIASYAGGGILLFLGAKILLEHTLLK